MEDVEIRQIRAIIDHRSCPKIEEFSVTTRTNSYRNIKAHRYRWSTKSSLVGPSWIVSYSFMCIFAPCRRHAALLEAWILGNLTRPRLAEPWAAFPSVSLTRPFARSPRFDPSLLTIRSWIALLFVQVSRLPETKRLSFFGLHFRTVNANYDTTLITTLLIETIYKETICISTLSYKSLRLVSLLTNIRYFWSLITFFSI